jgi:hypothetical protein
VSFLRRPVRPQAFPRQCFRPGKPNPCPVTGGARWDIAIPRVSDELDANLRRLPPDDAAEAPLAAVLNQIESIRNANGALHHQSRANLRNIADGAINRGSEATKADFRAFEHASTGKPSPFGRSGNFHRRRIQCGSLNAEWSDYGSNPLRGACGKRHWKRPRACSGQTDQTVQSPRGRSGRRAEERIGDGDRAHAASGFPDFHLRAAVRHEGVDRDFRSGETCSGPRDML